MPVAPISIPYLDLCYVLIYTDKVNILSKYMAHFLDSKDETIIIIIMLLIDNMTEFKKAYDDSKYIDFVFLHKYSTSLESNFFKNYSHVVPDVDGLDKGLDNQRKPFQNMMKVWAVVSTQFSSKRGLILVENILEDNSHLLFSER